MKRIFILCMLFSIIACNDDDNATPENLAGTSWKAVEFESEVEITTNASTTNFSYGFEGKNMDYVVTFDENTYSTEGSYDFETEFTSNGEVISNDTQAYTDVMGSGTYSTSNDTISFTGNFFKLEFNGQNLGLLQNTSTAKYEISGNQLIMTQNDVVEASQGSLTNTSTITSRSVWEKQ